MKSNRKNTFISLLPYILSATSMLLGFFTSYFLAKTLGADLYGEIRYVVSIFSTFSSIMLFGLTNLLLRESKNPEKRKTILNHSFSFLFFLSIFTIPIMIWIMKNYLHISNNIYLVCTIASSVAISINMICGSFYQGIGKYHVTQLITNIVPKSIMLAITLLFFFLFNYSWFANNYVVIYSIVYGSMAVLILLKYFRKFELGFSAKEYLSLTFFFGTTLTYSITTELTNIIQGAYYNNTVVLGIIGVSTQLLSILSLFTTVAASITAPLYADCKRKNDVDGIFETYNLNLRVTSYIAIPFYLFLILQGDKFLSFFGESYLSYPLVIVFCSFGAAVTVLTGQTGTILLMTGKEKIELCNGIFNILVYVLCAFLFRKNTIYGLVISNAISIFAVNMAKYIEVSIIYKRSAIEAKTLLAMALALGIDFIMIFFLKYISIWLVWLAVGFVVGCAAICVNFAIPPYRHDLKKLLELRKKYEE